MFPRLYRWQNQKSSVWAFGWLAGEDNDLVCVKPNIKRRIAAELALSPVCSTRLLALLAAILKTMLLGVDQNYRSLER